MLLKTLLNNYCMSVWKKKFKTLKDYYKAEYDPEFYQLEQFQFEIDPDETLDDVNAYDQQKQEEEIYKYKRVTQANHSQLFICCYFLF